MCGRFMTCEPSEEEPCASRGTCSLPVPLVYAVYANVDVSIYSAHVSIMKSMSREVHSM